MNTPNKLTLIRIVLVPVFMAFLLWPDCPHRFLIAGLVFGAAALTDLFDGRLARKNNQITDFGKFMDPIADKLLIAGALAAVIQLGLCSAWVLVLILAREFLVTSLRLVAASTGKVIAANLWGKVKTITQMVAVIGVFVLQEGAYLRWLPSWMPLVLIGEVLLWLSAAATVISGGVYLWQNRKFINTAK